MSRLKRRCMHASAEQNYAKGVLPHLAAFNVFSLTSQVIGVDSRTAKCAPGQSQVQGVHASSCS
jgi:hypothetical protein